MAKSTAGTYKKLKNVLDADKVTSFVYRTIPHEYWEPWGKKDIENMLEQGKISMQVSYEFIGDVMNIYSHLNRGNTQQEALVSIGHLRQQVVDYTYSKNLKTDQAKALFKSTLRNYDFLTRMDFDAMGGIGVSERTVNFLTFMQAYLEKTTMGSSAAKSGAAGTAKPMGGKTMVSVVTEEEGVPKSSPSPLEILQQKVDPYVHSKADENGDPTKPFEDDMTEDMMLTRKLVYDGGITAEVMLKGKKREFVETYKNLSKQQMQILENLSLLNRKTKIKYETKAHQEDDPLSKIKKAVLMRSHDEVSKTSMIQHALPTFKYKMATKSLIVHKPMTKHKQQQCLVMLIDYSGSMSAEQKQCFVKALLLNRMEAVIKGFAHLYVGGFEANRYTLHELKTREDCVKFYEAYNDQPHGDITNISGVLKQTVDELKANHLVNKRTTESPSQGTATNNEFILSSVHPEIIIINDGQDHIDAAYKTGWKTHAFLLGQDNKALRTVVENSGGHYERLF